MKTALLTAHTTAIAAMLKWFRRADAVIDGVLRLPELPQVRAVAHADAIFPAVSAASIIAKVNRDYVMRQYSLIYPGYGFDSNVGYHASTHVRGLAEQGVCALHRRSYAPIKRILGLL
jgi:ribonuclease HII